MDNDLENHLELLIAANTRSYQTPYPLTVMSARYGGSYEGGDWLAFNCYPHQIPEAAYDDDIACAGFWGWSDDAQPKVGRGATPNQAIMDLIRRLDSS